MFDPGWNFLRYIVVLGCFFLAAVCDALYLMIHSSLGFGIFCGVEIALALLLDVLLVLLYFKRRQKFAGFIRFLSLLLVVGASGKLLWIGYVIGDCRCWDWSWSLIFETAWPVICSLFTMAAAFLHCSLDAAIEASYTGPTDYSAMSAPSAPKPVNEGWYYKGDQAPGRVTLFT
jgi:hypothetical protein